MKRLLLFISTLLCANVLLAEDIVIDEIKYVITGINEVEVNKYQGSATAVNIPSNINYGGVSYSVTSIAAYAFSSKNNLTYVSIPNTIITIKNGAFYYCSGLTSLVIPNSVTSIGGVAFYGCSSLVSVVLGSGLTSIGENAFRGCSSLATVTSFAPIAPEIMEFTFYGSASNKTLIIPEGSDYSSWLNGNNGFSGMGSVVVAYTFTIGDLTYEVTGDNNVEVHYCNTSATAVEIPVTVTYNGTTYNVIAVGDMAFNGCNSLSAITCLSETGLPLVGNAFGLCTSNKTLTVPFGSDYSYWETATTWSKVYHKIPENTTITLSNDFTVTDLRTILNQGVLRITQNGQLINTTSENVSGVYEIETPTLPTDKWSFVGAPFNGYKLEAIKEGTNDVSVSLFDYGTGTWSTGWATVEDQVGAGEGYFLWSFAAEPTIFTTDSETQDDHYTLNNDVVTVTKDLTTYQGGNWMALANPYTFKLDVNKFLSEQSNIKGGVVYRFNGETWDDVQAGVINMTEGFFVNYETEGAHSVSFSKSHRYDGAKKAETKKDYMKLLVNDGERTTRLLFAQNDKAKQGDDLFDANKLFSPLEITEPYFVTDGVALVKEEVNTLPYTANLNIRNYQTKEVTISIDNIPEGVNVFLLDNGQDIKMNGGVEYTTTITEGENADRFQLLVKKQQRIERVKDNQITIKNNNRQITITSDITNLNIEVYNNLGQKILVTNDYNFTLDQVPAGSYVVKAFYGRVNQSQKIVVE
ncbi:MAG: leucine-rich repeat domain-containing protein [Bacteroidales bacterium]|nr:leucine-rich repeat domain-containing protein [Bacteroidales bacterium]